MQPVQAQIGSELVLRVRLANASGAALLGRTVDWSVAAQDGTVFPASSNTDLNGEATTTFTLSEPIAVKVVSAAAGAASTELVTHGVYREDFSTMNPDGGWPGGWVQAGDYAAFPPDITGGRGRLRCRTDNTCRMWLPRIHERDLRVQATFRIANPEVVGLGINVRYDGAFPSQTDKGTGLGLFSENVVVAESQYLRFWSGASPNNEDWVAAAPMFQFEPNVPYRMEFGVHQNTTGATHLAGSVRRADGDGGTDVLAHEYQGPLEGVSGGIGISVYQEGGGTMAVEVDDILVTP